MLTIILLSWEICKSYRKPVKDFISRSNFRWPWASQVTSCLWASNSSSVQWKYLSPKERTCMQTQIHFCNTKYTKSPQSEEAICFGAIFHFLLILWVSQSDLFKVFRACPCGPVRICITGINSHKKKSVFWASLKAFPKVCFSLLFKYLCFQGPP